MSSTYCVVLTPVDNCFVLRKLKLVFIWNAHPKNAEVTVKHLNETLQTNKHELVKRIVGLLSHTYSIRPKWIYTCNFITIATIAHKTQSRQVVQGCKSITKQTANL